jgi:type II secretory pathway component PulF
MAKSYNLANFCRTLGLLLKSGVHLADAMTMIAETTNNLAYRRSFEKISEAIVRGEPMSRQLSRDSNLFPDILPHMVAVGEATGNLSTTLLYLSELHEADVDDLTKNLSNAIEPILMIVMGLLVGFIAISIISPIYGITQNIQAR